MCEEKKEVREEGGGKGSEGGRRWVYNRQEGVPRTTEIQHYELAGITGYK